MSRGNKTRRGPRKGLIAVGIIVIVLAVLYAAVVMYFQKHYLPNTTVGDVDVSMKTAEYLKAKMKGQSDQYTLTITDRTGTEYTLEGTDISYQYTDTGEEEQILKEQDSLLWPLAFMNDSHYDMTLSAEYDEQQLEDAVNAMDFMQEENMTAPEDAYLDTSDGVQIVEEVEGTTVIPEKVLKKIEKAVQNQQDEVKLGKGCYEKPSVYSTDESLVSAKETLENYEKSTVTYTFGDQDTEELTSEDVLKLLKVSDDLEISVDEEKVTAYVQSLASKYNTYSDERKFKTSKGDKVTIGGGDYGWVIDKDEEAAQLIEDLQGFEPVTREPVYEQTAKKHGKNDIGNTYIEVDYTNQHMYYYKNGKLKLDCDVVTGNTSKGNGSPDGVFKIAYKQSPATLVGEDYSSPVEYFMPFAYNVGFHDASWRSSFGGEIYKTSGSHGCVNMPESKAEKLYKMVEVGTPVVAYYREKIKLTAENCKISNAYSYSGD